jgi:hypothetical protein
MDESDDIFKIKSIGDKFVVSEDKRKTISPHNSLKHFREADIPALCDQCKYRSIDAGGNGKCPKYEDGAVCTIRKDYISFINELDTRNPEDLKEIMDIVTKITFENVMMTARQSKFDGGVPDKNGRSEINVLMNLIKALSDLNSKITITERKEFSKEGDINTIFRQIKAKGIGKTDKE